MRPMPEAPNAPEAPEAPDAEERLALASCAFASGCILLAPREWISSGLALVLAAVLFGWHLRRRARAPKGGPAALAQGARGAQGAPGEEPRASA
ncbi:hypothetical protein [Sorangium atrum]|uniref:Uncharacterized protein n=1 Tax=Sorangium atrum TaxID=2995308 RepID=A0ABT5C1X1_9BACT|nr:hypothetical protein [Sorangium aterium]MDC0680413.1 hypothetical protein [Sorangium aterium]